MKKELMWLGAMVNRITPGVAPYIAVMEFMEGRDFVAALWALVGVFILMSHYFLESGFEESSDKWQALHHEAFNLLVEANDTNAMLLERYGLQKTNSNQVH